MEISHLTDILVPTVVGNIFKVKYRFLPFSDPKCYTAKYLFVEEYINNCSFDELKNYKKIPVSEYKDRYLFNVPKHLDGILVVRVTNIHRYEIEPRNKLNKNIVYLIKDNNVYKYVGDQYTPIDVDCERLNEVHEMDVWFLIKNLKESTIREIKDNASKLLFYNKPNKIKMGFDEWFEKRKRIKDDIGYFRFKQTIRNKKSFQPKGLTLYLRKQDGDN